MQDTLVSIFKNTFETAGKNAKLGVILDAIASGRWKDLVEGLPDKKQDRALYDQAKKNLPAVTFCGTFPEKRSIETIEEYNSLMVIDIDDMDSEGTAHKVKSWLISDKYTMACFYSPSGLGIKALVKLNTPVTFHHNAFIQLEAYYKKEYGIKIDKSGKDCSRLCYVSYDFNTYINYDSEEFEVDITIPVETELTREFKTAGPVSNDAMYIFKVAKIFTERKFQFVQGERNNYLHNLACTMNRCGVTYTEALRIMDNEFITPDKKWHQSVKGAYFHNKYEFGTYNVKVFEGDEKVAPVPDMVTYDEDSFKNEFIRMTIDLIKAKIPGKDIRAMMFSYGIQMRMEGFTKVKDFNLLVNEAHDIYQNERKKYMSGVSVSTIGNMASKIFNTKSNGERITSGIIDIDVLNTLATGNLYGMIGREGTMKSIEAQEIAVLNAMQGLPTLYYNGEMSDLQLFNRLAKRVEGIDIKAVMNKGEMTESLAQSIQENMTAKLKNNLFTLRKSKISCNELSATIESIQEDHEKRIRLVVVDGISSMADTRNDEIKSAIENSLLLKEFAKENDVAVIVLVHVKTGPPKHVRDTGESSRGGNKITGNMDGWFMTSLLIDPNGTDPNEEGGISYRKDMYYLRYFDKRESGEIVNKIMKISEPLTVEATELDPRNFEIKR